MSSVSTAPMSIVEAITRKPLREVREVFYGCVTDYIPLPSDTVTAGKQLHSADIIGLGPTSIRIEARYYAGGQLPLIHQCAELYGPGLAALAAGVAALGDIPVTPPSCSWSTEPMRVSSKARVPADAYRPRPYPALTLSAEPTPATPPNV